MRIPAIRWVLVALACALPLRAEPPLHSAQAPYLGREVPDFALLDWRGQEHRLRRADAGVVVLFFTANGCPVARQSYKGLKALRRAYEPKGVQFWLVNSNSGDDRSSIEKEAREFHIASMPVLLDEAQGLAALLGVRRTATAVCIETKTWSVIYQGAMNDQLVEGAQKPEPKEHYLREALEQFLAGEKVARAFTAARGCLISIPSQTISYATEVAPLLQKKCFGCHSPGNIGPMKMTSHAKVQGFADMIQEVLLARRMPPWQADSVHGSFVNDSSLSVAEARTLLRWIEQGATRGEGEDALAAAQPPSSDWKLGPPDAIVSLPKPEEIPATGVLDYRHIKVKVPFDEDVWLKAAVAKPGNTRVVHHIIARVRIPGQKPDDNQDVHLLGWAPGTPEMYFPEGTGKFLPRGSELDFEMHYTVSGKPEQDQSSIGLYVMKEKPRMTLRTQAAVNFEFQLSPDAKTDAVATYPFAKDTWLFDLSPHMHLRGDWFKFEALFPDGRRETLLSVPHYDFKWQHTYRLKEPLRMPAGSWLLCTGGFDNSARNPDNPNPKATVRWGEQSFDEMFIGFFSIAEVPPEKPLANR